MDSICNKIKKKNISIIKFYSLEKQIKQMVESVMHLYQMQPNLINYQLFCLSRFLMLQYYKDMDLMMC